MDFDIDNLRLKYSHLKRNNEDLFININPLQRGGVLTPSAQKALIEWGDGYSFCDNCLKGRIETIENPPMPDFYTDMAKFLKCDKVVATSACREAKKLAFWALKEKYPERNTVVIDANAHYSSYMAIEHNGLNIREVPSSGYPHYSIQLEEYENVINDVEEKTGFKPIAALLTHVDYNYGNYNNPEIVGKICKKLDVPFILNGAYSVGILPIIANKWNVDFISGSGHKSMAASGPIGVLGYSAKYHEIITAPSTLKGDLTNKTFPNKSFSYLGCPSVYGAPLATLMASFPDIVERTQNYEEEAKKANWLIEQLKLIEGIEILGMLPKIHPLTYIKTPAFEKIANEHKRKGFFLREEFNSLGITGMSAGISKSMKLSVYGLSWAQVKKIKEAFFSIAEKYQIYIGDN